MHAYSLGFSHAHAHTGIFTLLDNDLLLIQGLGVPVNTLPGVGLRCFVLLQYSNALLITKDMMALQLIHFSEDLAKSWV